MPWESAAKITVTTAGTPVRVTATYTPCHAIFVQTNPNNTGKIWVGNRSTMNTTTFVGVDAILPPPTSTSFPAVTAGIPAGPNALNLADVWLDADVNGESALVSYLVL